MTMLVLILNALSAALNLSFGSSPINLAVGCMNLVAAGVMFAIWLLELQETA